MNNEELKGDELDELLALIALGGATQEEAQRLRTQLSHDPKALQKLEEYRAVNNFLRSVPTLDTPPDSLKERLHKKIHQA